MKLCVISIVVLLVVVVLMISGGGVEGRRQSKLRPFEGGDFEFDEETEKNAKTAATEKKRWIHDPSSDLCRPLTCKKKEICLLEDTYTAVCVSRKELKKNGDIVMPKKKINDDEDDVFYDSDDDDDDDDRDTTTTTNCRPCPVVKPIFLCGADNRTYSSLCRLDYHNCIHRSAVRVSCKGFCPCKDSKKVRTQPDNNKILTTKLAAAAAAATVHDYNFVPQDIKYDNKHYKYIKYTKYAKATMPDKATLLKGYNDVTDAKGYAPPLTAHDPINFPLSKQCSPAALQSMGNRLLDWFSVVMADLTPSAAATNNKHRPVAAATVFAVAQCKPEVKWMFQHLDQNADGVLSLAELYDLENDQNEICLKPFLQQCDIDSHNHDLTVVDPIEWCKCFARADRPCAAMRRRAATDLIGGGGGGGGAYLPDCDSSGYYRPVQCHQVIGLCWCVDKHGVEYANTRTHARPECEELPNGTNNNNNGNIDSDDDESDESGTEEGVLEGSADRPIDY